jgi:hypothetical protein
MQPDCNFVLYSYDLSVLGSSGTGNQGSQCSYSIAGDGTEGVLTGDGRLIEQVNNSCVSSSTFAYHTGATVLSTGNINLYHIYWGDFSSSSSLQMKELVDFFAAHLGGSSWYNIMTAYYQIAGNVQTQMSNALTFVSSISVSTTTIAGVLSDTLVVATITNLIASKQLPLDPSAIYTLIFRGDTSYPGWAGTGGSQAQWCGYHGSFIYQPNNVKIFFSVMGDTGTAPFPGSCQAIKSNTVNGNVGADSLVSVYAHEVVEAASNGNGAWSYTCYGCIFEGYENGDMCAWNFGTLLPGSSNANVIIGGMNWLIQQNFVPNVGCKLAYP